MPVLKCAERAARALKFAYVKSISYVSLTFVWKTEGSFYLANEQTITGNKEFKTVFVFQEPLSRTNLPRGELLSLLELLHEGVSFEIMDTTHLSSLTFHESSIAGVTPFHVANIYFLEQSAIVVSNFPLKELEMIQRAGFIHSAGDLIFEKGWDDLTHKFVSDLLNDFSILKKEFFKVDFYTRSENDSHKQKLEKLMIDDRRYHIGPKSFQSARAEINKDHEEFLLQNRIQKEGLGNIFIFKDTGKKQPTNLFDDLYVDRTILEYAICYLSRYKRDNPLHTLDEIEESRPFWAGIFTTPHRLTNAMLNLAHLMPESKIVDPFCHTGTTAVESAQIGCEAICCDLYEVNGAKDNYEFFCSGAESLSAVSTKIMNIATSKPHVMNDFNNLAATTVKLNGNGLPEIREESHIEDIVNSFSESESDLNLFENRVCFYITRRYHLNRLRNNDVDKYKEAKELVVRFVGSRDGEADGAFGYLRCADQMNAFEEAVKSDGAPVIKASDKRFRELFEDSAYCSTRVGWMNKAKSSPTFRLNNILSDISAYEIPDDTIDAVITDPPYGYGEVMTLKQLQDIYMGLFEKAFRWLKSGGYLVLCALDKVKTGRTKGLLFTEDVVKMANRVAKGRRITFVTDGLRLGQKGPFYLYYWKSKYALNRAVIVLRILKENN